MWGVREVINVEEGAASWVGIGAVWGILGFRLLWYPQETSIMQSDMVQSCGKVSEPKIRKKCRQQHLLVGAFYSPGTGQGYLR
jgi:hypothetical protein